MKYSANSVWENKDEYDLECDADKMKDTVKGILGV